jgi:hypothetical protein
MMLDILLFYNRFVYNATATRELTTPSPLPVFFDNFNKVVSKYESNITYSDDAREKRPNVVLYNALCEKGFIQNDGKTCWINAVLYGNFVNKCNSLVEKIDNSSFLSDVENINSVSVNNSVSVKGFAAYLSERANEPDTRKLFVPQSFSVLSSHLTNEILEYVKDSFGQDKAAKLEFLKKVYDTFWRFEIFVRAATDFTLVGIVESTLKKYAAGEFG